MAESSSLREDSNVVSNDAKNTTTTDIPECEDANNVDAVHSETSSEADASASNLVVSEDAKAVLQLVARQVEYYFSTTNLERDTYVATLRSLNDGYVPISIIANFGKVRSMVPYESINAVKQAAMEFSHLLEVVPINTSTGKRVPEGEVCAEQTLDAVGPKSGQPIPAASLSATNTPVTTPHAVRPVVPVVTASVSPTSPPVQNTIILRETPPDVTQEQVRELFNFADCPPIKDIHPDVANCWFVTLDTSSRDEMLSVMFELRSKQFSGGVRIQARLKSVPSAPATVAAVLGDAIPMPSVPSLQAAVFHPQAARYNGGGVNPNNRKNKKKKAPAASVNGIASNPRTRNAGPNRRTATNVDEDADARQQRQNLNGEANKDGVQRTPKQSNITMGGGMSHKLAPSPPALGVDNFPALRQQQQPQNASNNKNNSSKVEVEKVPQSRDEDRPEGDDNSSYGDDADKKNGFSDVASTATTSSSSSSPQPAAAAAPMGGYAAALMKAAPPKAPVAASPPKTDTKAPAGKPVAKMNGNKANDKQVNPPKGGDKGRRNRKEPSDSGNNGKDLRSKVRQQKPVEAAVPAPKKSDNPVVSVAPPAWGKGRSFADIL